MLRSWPWTHMDPFSHHRCKAILNLRECFRTPWKALDTTGYDTNCKHLLNQLDTKSAKPRQCGCMGQDTR